MKVLSTQRVALRRVVFSSGERRESELVGNFF
jgi:hypothetical protein